jgi:hypothetical protein
MFGSKNQQTQLTSRKFILDCNSSFLLWFVLSKSWWVIPYINPQKSVSTYPWFMILHFPFLEILLLNVYKYISDILLFSSCWKQRSLSLRTEFVQQKTSEYIMAEEHLYIWKDEIGWEEIRVKMKCCCLLSWKLYCCQEGILLWIWWLPWA